MKYNKLTVSLCVGLIFAILFSMAKFDASCEDIRNNVLRLHITANSDSEYDQALKLKVKDAILNESEYIFDNSLNINDAKNAALQNLNKIKAAAKAALKENGEDYNVEVSLGNANFNTRIYENFTLPAGEYLAVRVVLGEGKGKNWWCVMFPSLCVPSAEEHSLREVVNNDAADICENNDDYKIKFKIVEIYEQIKAKLSSKNVYTK